MNLYPILFTVITFLSTLLGGFVVAKYKNSLGAIISFAAAVLISVPLFDLLPETFKLAAETQVSLENVMYMTAAGFMFLYVVERYFSVRRVCQGGVCENITSSRGGLWGTVELSAVSFMDGFTIGLSFRVGFQIGIIVAVAVIANDFVDGIDIVSLMLNSGSSMKASIGMLVIDATAPILGAATTLFFVVPERYLVFLLPFFAGGFLYLGASELLPKACEKNPPLVSLISSFAGFISIFILTRLLNI